MNEYDNARELPAYSKDGSVHVTDEIINTATHIVGSFFALFGTVLLIVSAAAEGKVWHVVSFAVYGVSLFISNSHFEPIHTGSQMPER